VGWGWRRARVERGGGRGDTLAVMWRVQRVARVVVVVAVALAMTACATSREMALRRKADRVETQLKTEQKRVLSLPAEDATRPARLTHLDELRTTLSAANVALGTVSDYVPSAYRGTAYDVLDEVYGTIEWNIPLGPTDLRRPLPRQFQGGVLRLN